MLLNWSKIYQTGHPQIDAQHKRIVDEMNRLHVMVENREDIGKIKGVLDFLDKYVASHFAYEEKCVEEFKCPNAEKNKEAHAEFMERVKEIQELSKDHELTHPEVLDVYYEMIFWIKDHILEVDVNNFHCVRDKLKSEDCSS